ncbi:tRNA threonylcarbamoyladenosine biosynthesis protein [Peptostreptococcus sp. MV1]|uniref:L-threonylcarbamoyladenylate synthase n=1 Tax=Peptostreptococcus sp. MV1 TaxID=1219626 RepID=UPI00050E6419|nr:L-threonylcarbamoyladenylate synthase [Peptostreptococcus sp. MV1]KGF12718.1 tRNA threonylcarbamoyladenosine biosynthesis protein [Peptostreptococcus sp. MV1]
MKTLIKEIDINEPDKGLIDVFAAMLADGKTVIFPTETVYGLGANALDEDAAAKIYQAKGRPSDNPLLVHVADKKDVYDLVENIDGRAKLLMEKFWPGPLTIVFKKKDIIPDRTSGGLDTVAIRMPSDPVARQLIRRAGVPIAAPSANISGRPSPTKPDHIIRDMDGRVDGILVGGPCNYGVESTIVDLSSGIAMVLRPGSVTLEMLKEVLGQVELDPSLKNKDDNIKAKAPGMKYKHYSPQAQVYIVKANDLDDFAQKVDALCLENEKKKLRTGVMTRSSDGHTYRAIRFDLGESDADLAKNLFDVLIGLDRESVDIAYVPYFEEKGLGVAIMNRLKKAAAYRII